MLITEVLQGFDFQTPKIESVCFTGHHPPRLSSAGDYKECEAFQAVRVWLERQICNYVHAEPCLSNFITGGALGVDTWAADLVVDMDYKLSLYLPFPEMGHNWPKLIDQETLRLHKEYAGRMGEVKFICPTFSNYAYILRDYSMVDASQLVLAVWDGSLDGGTYKTIQYAQRQQKMIHRYNPKEVSESFYLGERLLLERSCHE